MSMTELEKRCVDALDGCEAHIEDDSEAIAIVRAVLAEAGVAELVEALDFYADKSAWNQPPVQTVESVVGVAYQNKASQMQKDRGVKARAALAKIGANQ